MVLLATSPSGVQCPCSIKRFESFALFLVSFEGDSTNLEENKLDAVPTAGWKPKANDGYTGQMIITNLEKNAPNGENATIKVDFTGVGALTKVDPIA